jgi:hypothetical protein
MLSHNVLYGPVQCYSIDAFTFPTTIGRLEESPQYDQNPYGRGKNHPEKEEALERHPWTDPLDRPRLNFFSQRLA